MSGIKALMFKFNGALAPTSVEHKPGPLFTTRADVLPQDLMKSPSREILVEILPIALKFNRHLGSRAAEMPIIFQSDTINITSNLAASRLYEMRLKEVTGELWWVYCILEKTGRVTWSLYSYLPGRPWRRRKQCYTLWGSWIPCRSAAWAYCLCLQREWRVLWGRRISL